MTWRRLGRVFCPENNQEWMASHAANPFAEPAADGRRRIYFSCRDSAGRSSIGNLLLNMGDLAVEDVSAVPVLGPGPTGAFDDSGVSLGCVVGDGDDRYLYYVGWNLAVTVPFRNSIGLAISSGGREFVKQGPAPVLDRSLVDPLSLSYPWVLKDGPKWMMWYGSTLRWREDGREQDHVIKYAESPDGVRWTATGKVCIGIQSNAARAFSRPCVIFEDGLYRMWFSYRGDRYRIGYAESADGVDWAIPGNNHGLECSGEDWESESVEYPHVFDHAGRRYLLYCGDGYGRTGFGLAVWDR